MIGNNLLLAGTDEGYNLSRSLRFRSSASASLSRTPASAGNRKTWTWSAWVKRGSLSSNQVLFISKPSATSDATFTIIGFSSSNTLLVSGYSVQWRNTTQVFRDPSAWYHIVVTWDTTQATAANRVKVYVNGSQVTAFGTTFDPSLNFDGAINQADAHYFCYPDGYSYSYFDGYLTEVNFVDGQGLTPSSFGETDTITGVWKPKRYAGTYGTNGFYLQFTDNSALTTSSNVGLGKDFSGNGNYWTTNNISITSGVTYDSMTDVPTLTSATAANFAVLNPIDSGSSLTIADGNLKADTTASAWRLVRSSIAVTSGKWYWEVTCVDSAGSSKALGVCTNATSLTSSPGANNTSCGYGNNGTFYYNGTSTSLGAGYTGGDVMGVAFDADANTITYYRNGTVVNSGGTATGVTTSPYFIATFNAYGTLQANFGQRPFAYTPPTGYVALNTYNLPTSTIVKGNTVMDATLWTGDGTAKTIVNAAPFKPDFVWIKQRSGTASHVLTDSVRGAGYTLQSNGTDAEIYFTTVLTSFNNNGFSVGASGNTGANGATYVGWQWQAGQGTTSTNTSGTITSTVSVNASAGFSVVTYTGNGNASATVGHGLGVKPSMIIVKERSTNVSGWNNWIVYHSSIGATGNLYLNLSNVTNTSSYAWNNTEPTSSVFTIAYASGAGLNYTSNYVAYCFAPIAGYSAFGSYTGNGSADGPFVYTGFRPKFILFKASNNSTNWVILDTARDTYNVAGNYLYPNTSGAEGNVSIFDIVSNGFKVRTALGGINSSSDNIIYAAFAETPTKFALAR